METLTIYTLLTINKAIDIKTAIANTCSLILIAGSGALLILSYAQHYEGWFR